ncbi:hypothetical protein K502DRAFT_322498 [Neoconidiobolus thromboides FSU 785]|nr:hypothetical protein K502DRAFT_322498 [Neoconidiobolus thromboides FSU 785]
MKLKLYVILNKSFIKSLTLANKNNAKDKTQWSPVKLPNNLYNNANKLAKLLTKLSKPFNNVLNNAKTQWKDNNVNNVYNKFMILLTALNKNVTLLNNVPWSKTHSNANKLLNKSKSSANVLRCNATKFATNGVKTPMDNLHLDNLHLDNLHLDNLHSKVKVCSVNPHSKVKT